MRVRTRLVASFAYVLLVVIVALTVPLAIVLRDRARSELEAVALGSAQTIASVLNRDRLEDDAADRDALASDADRWAAEVWPVVVLDDAGTVLADSDREDLGEDFATGTSGGRRRRVAGERGGPPQRRGGGDIAVAAAPILDEGQLVGAVRISRGVGTVQENGGAPPRRSSRWRSAGSSLGSSSRRARSLARAPALVARHDGAPAAGRAHRQAGDLEGGTEIDELAGSFDEMAGRMERTVRSQREFVANASHQPRTPLTGIKLRLEAAAAETTDGRCANSSARRTGGRPALADHRTPADDGERDRGGSRPERTSATPARAIRRWSERAAGVERPLGGTPT